MTSGAQAHDISDIHQTSVAETLSVSTDIHGAIQSQVQLTSHVTQPLTVTVPTEQPPIPSVGVSISVADSGNSAAAVSDRASSTLLNIASNSLNLTEILSAQQQALEQFQCQLQLAQQTEAINQRLDAIERTLSSLIQHKAQEEVVKSQQSTPVRPSQSLQSLAEGSLIPLSDGKKLKLPRELCVST